MLKKSNLTTDNNKKKHMPNILQYILSPFNIKN